jgi:hypothetical protein
MEQRAATIAKARHFRALEINLAVERHEYVHSIQLLISGGEGETLAREFIGKILDGGVM